MASEPYTDLIGDFSGGMADGYYSQTNNQFAMTDCCDFFSEQGVLKSLHQLATIASLSSSVVSENHVYSVVKDDAGNDYTYYALASHSSSTSTAVLIRSNDLQDWTISSLSSLGTSTPSSSNRNARLALYYNEYYWTMPGDNAMYKVDDPDSPTTVTSFTPSSSQGMQGLLVKDSYLYYGFWDGSKGNLGFFNNTSGSASLSSPAFHSTPASLDLNYSINDIEKHGEYILVAGVRGKNSGATARALVTPTSESIMYVWDGVSTVFETKVYVPGCSIEAIKSLNGIAYLLCVDNSNYNIYVYIWRGGQSLELAWTWRINSTTRPFINKNAVTTDGRFIYFGIKSATTPDFNGIFAFGSHHGEKPYGWIRQGWQRFNNSTSMEIACMYQDAGLWIVNGAGISSNRSNVGITKTGTSGLIVTTNRSYGNGKFKLNKVKVRHEKMRNGDSISITYNPNIQTFSPSLALKSAPVTLKQWTASSLASGPGDIGSSQISSTTFTNNDGTPFYLLDQVSYAINLPSSVSNSSQFTRVLLPIIVDLEMVKQYE